MEHSSFEEKAEFYMQLCGFLLNKFSNGHIEIDRNDWSKSHTDKTVIKYRINNDDKFEVLVSEEAH